MALQLSDKVDFKVKKITEQGETFQINPPRRHPKYTCTEQQTFKIHKANTNTAKRRKRKFHNYSWKLLAIKTTTRQTINNVWKNLTIPSTNRI